MPEKENERVEFKSSFSDAVIETLVAFANSHGGCVYVGLDDLGSPVPGFTIGKESIAKWVNEVKSKTQPSLIPDVDVQHVDGGSVLCVSIPEYPVKPVSCRGRYYKRVSNSNHQMNLNEIANLHLQTINLSWDYTVDPRHGMDDISLEKVALFIRTASELRGMNITDDPLIVLHKYELLRAEQITVGCFLLFCKDAGLLTTIDAGRFDSETIIRDNATIRGDLIAEVDACMNFVRKHISKRYVITGKPQRDEVWEYPLEAVREIVINMIVHRDYRAVADSSIKIFDNRIEFVNMGSLPEGVSLDDVLSGRNPSLPRNKQIASIFKEVGLIEKYGSGIRRVLQIYKQMGAPVPKFEISGALFKVTLYPVTAEVFDGGVSGGVNGGVSGGVNKVLEYIQHHPGKRSREISLALDIPQRTTERYLKQLKQDDLVMFKGAPKSGGYVAL